MKEESEDTETIEATPEQKQSMAQAEYEMEKRQIIEYKDRPPIEPESQIALDKTLLGVEIKSAETKEMIPNIIQMPDGSLRPKAVKIEGHYPEILSDDIVRANIEEEMESIWGNALFSNFLAFFGQSRKINLQPAAKFSQINEHLFIDTSRGKHGFNLTMTKTDKHISEGAIQHVTQALVEKKKKTWGVF